MEITINVFFKKITFSFTILKQKNVQSLLYIIPVENQVFFCNLSEGTFFLQLALNETGRCGII